MEQKKVSKSVLKRLPGYLDYLKSLSENGPVHISATALANALGMGEVQVRKDLAMVSDGGRPKIGYVRQALIDDIEQFLGYDNTTDAVLIGACVPVGMMIAQLGKGPSVPLPSITLQSLAELETMREMIACEDEQVLNDYLHSITGGGAQSRQDLIDFVGLVDNTPYVQMIDGEITSLTYNKTDERFSVSVEAENGDSLNVSYELGMSDVEKNMKKGAYIYTTESLCCMAEINPTL